MGAGKSKSQFKKKRPSVHSGKLYINPNPSQNSNPSQTNINSQLSASNSNINDFDKSASELKQKLPDNLKVYSNSIQRMYEFWHSNVEVLSPPQFKELSVLFYVNVFQLIPDAHGLFTKNIEIQSAQFFGMFSWLINSLTQPNPGRLIKSIKKLGDAHSKMKIAPEWYLLFLKAFHETMIDQFKIQYTARIRFCMEQLYTVVMNIMVNKDFTSVASPKIVKLLRSMKNLKDCLNDDEGRTYLELYMKQQFCVELILFYKEYRKFKVAVSDYQKQSIGANIMKQYISSTAECEINLSYVVKLQIDEVLNQNNNQFTSDIFDNSAIEITELIRVNIWKDFKDIINSMTVPNDMNASQSFDLIQ